MVNDYTDQIADLIANGLTPDQVCDALGLCNVAASRDLTTAVRRAVLEQDQERRQEVRAVIAEAEQAQETGEDRPYCVLCEYAIGEVDKMLEDKQDEEEIKEALDKICYMLT